MPQATPDPINILAEIVATILTDDSHTTIERTGAAAIAVGNAACEEFMAQYGRRPHDKAELERSVNAFFYRLAARIRKGAIA